MDYEAMTTPELQAECRRRGLASGRVKADLVARLVEADAADGTTADADPDTPEGEAVAGEHAPQAPAEDHTADTPHAAMDSTSAGLPTAFRMSFPAEDGGPDEETHLAYRQATIQAAIAEGRTPRGDARLAATVDGRWVYEVSVRAVT